MLIRFVVENFKSFKEETEFNLLTGDSSAHGDHIHHTDEGIDILPISVIYGGNASGKTNLVAAIYTAKLIVTQGTNSKGAFFPVEKYALDNTYFEKPTKFEFEFKTNKHVYSYGLIINPQEVVEEWLYIILSKKTDKKLFERKGRQLIFSKDYFTNPKDLLFLENEARGLRLNQPFLTESNLRETGFFDDAYNWFNKILQIIFPLSQFSGYQELSPDKLKFINQLLNIGDTNVSVNSHLMEIEQLEAVYSGVKDIIDQNSSIIQEKGYILKLGNITYHITYDRIREKFFALKLVTYHWNENQVTQKVFEIFQESDGTKRLIDLGPGIYSSTYEDSVLIIDEIDRSMHPILSKKIIEFFLENRKKKKGTGQLICTTHEHLILDKKLLRPDEIWFVQRKDKGYSVMYPLSEFELWEEIDFQTGYLNGRFGAIPTTNSSNNNLNAITSNAKEK